jgi:asparagine synthase (glutamine-hydrolysing)
MSAIAGLWRFAGRPMSAGVGRMLGAMAVFGRGPAGIWRADGIELGRRLTTTVPEDAADRHPYSGRDGMLHLVADVRLDNRSEIAGLLGFAPAAAAALADAELLMRAWERFGPGCLKRLTGEYAVALWDATERKLLLARDPVGSRPLFYHEGQGCFAFATAPSGLLALPDVPYGLDEERLACGAMHLPGRTDRSFFQGIRSVRAGELLIVAANGIRRQQYWRAEDVRLLRLRSPAECADALRDALDRAVKSQMRGLGPVSAQLSAGLDSACIVSSAALQLGCEGRRLVAFTAAPRQGYNLPVPHGRLGDESGHAAALVAHYGNIEHVVLRGGSATPFDHLDRYFAVFQQPTVNLCNHVWLDDIWSTAVARGLPLMLTGLMGNATVSYRDVTALRSLAAPWNWPALAGDIAGFIARGEVPPRSIVAAVLGPLVPTPLWRTLKRWFGAPVPDHGGLSAAHPDLWREWEHAHRARHFNAEGRIKYGQDGRRLILDAMDIGPVHKGVLAGWGLDLRQPAADLRVIETCLAMPLREFTRGGVLASVYHRAFADRLPPTLLAEQRRGLQAADWHEGLAAGRGKLLAELERIEASRTAQRTLDLPRLRRLAETLPDRAEDYLASMPALRFVLLRGIALGHFIRRADEGRSVLVAHEIQHQQTL